MVNRTLMPCIDSLCERDVFPCSLYFAEQSWVAKLQIIRPEGINIANPYGVCQDLVTRVLHDLWCCCFVYLPLLFSFFFLGFLAIIFLISLFQFSSMVQHLPGWYWWCMERTSLLSPWEVLTVLDWKKLRIKKVFILHIFVYIILYYIIWIHTYICMHVLTLSDKYTCTPAHTHGLTCIHTCIHTYIHTYY